MVRVGPGENLLDGETWLVVEVRHASLRSRKPGQRGSAGQASKAKTKRLADGGPFLARCLGDRAAAFRRPPAGALVVGIRPREDLLLRKHRQVLLIAGGPALGQELRQRGAAG